MFREHNYICPWFVTDMNQYAAPIDLYLVARAPVGGLNSAIEAGDIFRCRYYDNIARWLQNVSDRKRKVS